MEYIVIEIIAVAILLLYPVWRIFKRAGFNPALSLTILIPFIGFIVSGLILALSSWKLKPAQEGEK